MSAVDKAKSVKPHDYKHLGLNHAGTGKAPRCTQSRLGGPPLLFKTDARATVLAHLAIANGPTRSMDLSQHLRRNHSKSVYTILLTKLANEGLISKWKLPALPGERACRVYYDLNPAYPGARELRALLWQIAIVYPGFSLVPYQPDNATAGVAPSRRPKSSHYVGRRFTIDYALGDDLTTKVLLGIYVMGQATNAILRRGATTYTVNRVGATLHKLAAFGILKKLRDDHAGRAGSAFVLDKAHPLHLELVAYLAALDIHYPLLRFQMQNQASSRRVNNFGIRRTTRLKKPWKRTGRRP